MRRTGDQRQFWGPGKVENQDFYFGETGEQSDLFQGNGYPTGRAHLFIVLLNVLTLKEKFMACHNHTPQPVPDTKVERKKDRKYACKINKQRHEKHSY